jgi:TonB family protein
MKFSFTLSLLLTTVTVFAQKQNVTFHKNNGKPVLIRDSADYIRVVSEPDQGSSLYKVNEYYPNGKLKRTAESTTVSPVKPEGTSISYYTNGNKQAVNKYVGGLLKDEQYLYHPNGKLSELRNYAVASTETKFTLINPAYTVLEQQDSTGKSMVTNGNGHYITTQNGLMTNVLTSVQSEGDIKNGVKEGVWKSTIGKDSINLVETYEKGILVNGVATFANGDISRYDKAEKLPEFKGGMQAFYKFLSKNLRYPAEDQKARIQGRVNVTFVVEKDGSITNVRYVGKSPSETLSAEAVRVLNESPKWIPAVQFGRMVRVQYTVPIVFTL